MEAATFDPPPGVAEVVADGLRRLLAPNPGPMTFRGTNTYLLGNRGIAVIDPGPDNPAHLAAILGALGPGQAISHILVTHAHRDHSPLARRLSAATDAPVLAFGDAQAGRSAVMQDLAASGMAGGGEGVDIEFSPDAVLQDKTVVAGDGWEVTALWTPGHMGNHLCFAWTDTVFSGDLVMDWATSLISPPDGDVAAFRASCRRLRAHGPRRLWPGHGAPVDDPAARIDWLMAHREAREAQILAVLEAGPMSPNELALAIYRDTVPTLLPAAARNVLAHLADLASRGVVTASPRLGPSAVFDLARRA
ncbi:MAG: MBL fold metallo-hydrolase [Rhodobacteraceae bacterium]|nr:MBL fold metallo-hydrolase [Paracoccaceae bacterium]